MQDDSNKSCDEDDFVTEYQPDRIGYILDLLGRILGIHDQFKREIDLFELGLRALLLIIGITIAILLILSIFGIWF